MNPTIRRLLDATPEQRKAILSALSPDEMAIVYKELEVAENAPTRRWYCPREECDGNPHAGFHWCEHDIDSKNHNSACKHARTSQRPPYDDPDHPWLVWGYFGGRGTGKLLALETPVPTPFGWTTMGALKVGDVVFDEQGRMCNVTATFDEMPERAYRFGFSDGTEILAGGEHQWVTLDAKYRKQARRREAGIPKDWADKPAITTDEIVATLTQGKRSDRNHAIPTTLALETPAVELPIDPYVLGCWLGDGSSAGAEITCHDDDAPTYVGLFARAGEAFRLVRRRFADKPVGIYTIGEQPYKRGENGQMMSNGSIHSRLRESGLIKNKHVPDIYMRASVEQRTELLRGLMDTDGTADKRGLVEFGNKNEQLVKSVVELARSLGEKPVAHSRRVFLNGKDCGIHWRVTWRPAKVNPFNLERKRKRINPLGAQATRNLQRMIVSAEEIPIQPMRCITVDSPNSMYLVGEGMIPTHNTRAGAEWVLDLVWNQGYKRIALIGRTPADVRDVMIYGDSGIMACSDPHPRPAHEPTKRRLIFPNGAQCFTYSAAAPSQLRGPQHDASWGDELAAWTDAPKGDSLDTSYNNLMLGLRLGKNPKALFTTTPKRVRIIREIADRKTTVITTGTTYENLDNLAPSFRENVLQAYEGTRIGQQELLGLMMTDVDGAMWTMDMIDPNRGELLLPSNEEDEA